MLYPIIILAVIVIFVWMKWIRPFIKDLTDAIKEFIEMIEAIGQLIEKIIEHWRWIVPLVAMAIIAALVFYEHVHK